MTRQRLFSTLLFLTSMLYVHAQFADPREKFSITADVDGATNTDYYWKSDKGERLEEGRLKHGDVRYLSLDSYKNVLFYAVQCLKCTK